MREENREEIQAKDCSMHIQNKVGNCVFYANSKIIVLLYFKPHVVPLLNYAFIYPIVVLSFMLVNAKSKTLLESQKEHSRNRCNKEINGGEMRDRCAYALIF